MKTLIFALLFAMALGTTQAESAWGFASPVAYRVDQVFADTGSFARGATERTVKEILGSPYKRLTPETFVYLDFEASSDLVNRQNCNFLIVIFDRQQVVELKLVNQRALRDIATKLKPTRVLRQIADSR